ncbi:hypothetical protein ACLOJK_004190 [Asimina triloba]
MPTVKRIVALLKYDNNQISGGVPSYQAETWSYVSRISPGMKVPVVDTFFNHAMEVLEVPIAAFKWLWNVEIIPIWII